VDTNSSVGSGDRESGLLKMLKASGYTGAIGIIGHTENEDVKIVLERNIEGLKKILAEMGDQKALATYKIISMNISFIATNYTNKYAYIQINYSC
jgi:hypothetical protein